MHSKKSYRLFFLVLSALLCLAGGVCWVFVSHLGEVRYAVGSCYHSLDRYTEASPHFEEALHIHKEKRTENTTTAKAGVPNLLPPLLIYLKQAGLRAA